VSSLDLSFSLLFFYSFTAADIKGKRKSEYEPDTDHEQRQRNAGAPENSKRLKIDRVQGIHHIFCLLPIYPLSLSQEGRTGGYPQKVGACGSDLDMSPHIGNSYSSRLPQHVSTCQRRTTVVLEPAKLSITSIPVQLSRATGEIFDPRRPIRVYGSREVSDGA